MAALMTDATALFTGAVNMVNAFTNGTVTAGDIIFAAFAGGVGLGLFSYVKNILR